MTIFIPGDYSTQIGYYRNFGYYNASYGFITTSVFSPIISIVILAFIVLCIGISIFIVNELTNLKNRRSNFTEYKSFWVLLKENFLLFYLFNVIMIIILFYMTYVYQIPKYINEFFIMTIGFNLSLFFLKAAFDLKEAKLSIKPFQMSQAMNLILFSLIFLQYRQIYFSIFNFYEYFNEVTYLTFAYACIGLSILAIRFRKQLKFYSSNIYSKTKHFIFAVSSKTKHFTITVFSTSKSIIAKMNPVTYVLYYITLRKLNNDDQAVFFAKKFIIIQSKHLKNALPSALPSTITKVIQKIFEDDIERLQQLFKINYIRTYSNKAILKFVMNTANLIIKDLQKTLQEHLTEELLKENNDAKKITNQCRRSLAKS